MLSNKQWIIVLVSITWVHSFCVSQTIDSFTTVTNDLGGTSSDLGTMRTFTKSNGFLTVNAKNKGSRFVETGFCQGHAQNALVGSWGGIQFTINPGSVTNLDFYVKH